MRDAIGGSMVIQIIIIFLLIVNSYLAFSVNYTKAFKMKNEIITIIEKNEGLTEKAKLEIAAYMDQVSYYISGKYTSNGCKSPWIALDGYCVMMTKQDNNSAIDGDLTYGGTYYTVKTFISIDVPILSNLFQSMPDTFKVMGITKTIYSSGTNSVTP